MKWLSVIWKLVSRWRLFPVTMAVLVCIFIYRDCSDRSQLAAETKAKQELAQKLASSEKTVEVQKDLYAKTVIQVTNLVSALHDEDGQLSALKKQLNETGDRLATADQLVIKWKKAYEGAVKATQTEQPGVDPDGTGPEPPIVRKRVDFSEDWRYIGVHGYTLTDPPEGYVVVEQLRPLKLAVGLARGKDGQWRAYVKSSEEGVAVDINLAAVDEGVLLPKKTWRDRLWVDGVVGFLGTPSAGVDVSYRFDKISLGVGCNVQDSTESCGISLGFRPFK